MRKLCGCWGRVRDSASKRGQFDVPCSCVTWSFPPPLRIGRRGLPTRCRTTRPGPGRPAPLRDLRQRRHPDRRERPSPGRVAAGVADRTEAVRIDRGRGRRGTVSVQRCRQWGEAARWPDRGGRRKLQGTEDRVESVAGRCGGASLRMALVEGRAPEAPCATTATTRRHARPLDSPLAHPRRATHPSEGPLRRGLANEKEPHRPVRRVRQANPPPTPRERRNERPS